MKTLRFVILLILIFTVNIIAQERRSIKDKEFVLKNEKWYQVYAEKEYEVNPSVITVKFKEGVNKTVVDAFVKNSNLKVVRSNQLGFIDVEIPIPNDALGTVQSFLNNEIIEIVEANTYGSWDAIPNDIRFAEQWNLEQLSDFDIDVSWGWDINTGISSVVIGILDSGTEYNHEDLGIGFDTYQNIWTNPNEVPGNLMDDDGNGFVDDWKGWDFFQGDNDPMPAPFNPNLVGTWHGTAVAGVASAKTNNMRGIAGVAGGWGGPGTKLMILRIGNENLNSGLIDDAILYAVNNGAKIINMSFRVPQNAAIDAAIGYAYTTKGCLLIAASGNQGSSISYPANHTQVMAVGATDQNDVLATFSNRGSQQSVCAPGVSILTTFPTNPSNLYFPVGGTSFAAPHVAGTAALLLSVSPNLSPSQIRDILQQTAEDRGVVGWDEKYGYGRVNVYKALRYVFSNYGGQIKTSVLNNWNMTSVPLQLLNYSKPLVYPTSTSPAWQLTPTGYIAADPLANGVGYWIRFGAAQDITYNHLGIFSIDMTVHTGWNIVGSITQKVNTSQVVPINTNIISSFFEYNNNGYTVTDNIIPGKGYWIKVSQAGTLRINIPLPVDPPTGVEPPIPNLISPANGSTVEYNLVTLQWSASPGATSYDLIVWRLVGGPWYNYYGLTATSKSIRNLEVGMTYKWSVRAVNLYGASAWSDLWTFTVGTTPHYTEDVVESFESLDNLTIIDSDGNQQNLFIVNDKRVLSHDLLMSAIMPPEPPAGIPSIRFESGKFIEKIPSDQKIKKLSIKVKDLKYPLTVKWNVKKENSSAYWVTRPGRDDRINISGIGSMVLSNIKDGVINLECSASLPISPVGKNNFTYKQLETLPTEYGLSQNHPNPFNPTTVINYQLPIDNWVTLKVYDVLGKEVATLVSEYKEAGYYEATFDAAQVSSGVYFYRIEATSVSDPSKSFTQVRKMILMR